MADKPVSKFGDAWLLDTSPCRFVQTAGVHPSTGLLPTTPIWAQHEFDQIGPRTFFIRDWDETLPCEWRGLELLRKQPGPNPFIVHLLVADRRWRWPYRHIIRDYNMRRRIGTTRRGDWQELIQQEVDPEFDYREYSLNQGRQWTALEVLHDVLHSVDPFANIVFENDVAALDQLPIENLMIDDAGPSAVARALTFIPGASVTVDPNGDVRVFNTTTGAEVPLLNSLKPIFEDEGNIEYVDYRRMRPAGVVVYFTVESELRFDSVDFTDAAGSTVISKYKRNMKNVLAIPDFKLTMADGRDEAQGTYVDFEEYIAAVTSPPGTLVRINFDLLNRISIPGIGPWSALLNAGKQALNPTDAKWDSRLGAMLHAYRTTYQINRQWIDRVRTLKAELISTVNRQTGQRAKSPAFADYHIIPSQKGILRTETRRAGGSWFFGYNVDSYPGEDADIMTLQGVNSLNVPAPASVTIPDPDQGIIQINFQVDRYGNQDKILPGKVTNIPVRSVRPEDVEHGVPTAWNAQGADYTKVPKLSENHRVAVVVTATPTSPNSKERMYAIIVRPKDVKGLLSGGALSQGLDNVNHSLFHEIRIGASVETARVAWVDARSSDIEQLFGITPDGGAAGNNIGRANIDGLVVNDTPQESLGSSAASLPAIALAAAAAVYARVRDRLEGTASVRSQSQVKMVGNIATVQNVLMPDGVVKTVLGMGGMVAELDMFGFMSADVRSVILKTVKPQ